MFTFSQNATQHVHVSGVGILDRDQLKEAFDDLGPSEILVGRDGSRPAYYAVFSFPEVAAAEVAANVIQHRCYSGDKSLSTRFVCLRAAACPPPPQIEALTSAKDIGVPGLFLFHDFVTAQEEQELIAAIDGAPWQPLAKRRVQHYGYEFRYDIRGVDPETPCEAVPAWASAIRCRIAALLHKLPSEQPLPVPARGHGSEDGCPDQNDHRQGSAASTSPKPHAKKTAGGTWHEGCVDEASLEQPQAGETRSCSSAPKEVDAVAGDVRQASSSGTAAVYEHSAHPGLDTLNQLTVNEYNAGVGLSRHIDTHSAFTGTALYAPRNPSDKDLIAHCRRS